MNRATRWAKRSAVAITLAVGLPAFFAGLHGSQGSRAWADGHAADGRFTMTGAASGLFPGRTAPLFVTITNPHPFALDVHRIDFEVRDAGPGCDAANVRVMPFSGAQPIPKESKAVVRTSVGMVPSAPDACQGGVFPLRLAGTASRSAPRGLTVSPHELVDDGYVNIEESSHGERLVTTIAAQLEAHDEVTLDLSVVDANGNSAAATGIRLDASRPSQDAATDVRALADGPIAIAARGMSALGYVYEATAERILDLGRPTVRVGEPPFPPLLIGSTAKIGGPGAEITGVAQDNLEVRRVSVYLRPRLALTVDTRGPIDAELDGPASDRSWKVYVDPGPGLWDVWAVAVDAAGNTSEPAPVVTLLIV